MSGTAGVAHAPLSEFDLRRGSGGTWLPETGTPPASVTGVSIDSRTLAPGQLFVALVGPRFDGHAFLAQAQARGAAAALVQRDVAAPAGLPLLRVADTTRALGLLGAYARGRVRLPVAAVTGSLGKTTTKDIAAVLLSRLGPVLKTEGNLNNQYGLPLTLLRLSDEYRAAVLELGMSAAGELTYLSTLARPDVAVITRVAPVHLEFFESLEAIARAKAEIFAGLGDAGVAVLNHDDPYVRAIGEARRGRVVWFGRDRACLASAENWRGTAHGMRFDLRLGGRSADVALPLPGPHNVTNFLAAAAVAHVLGLDAETVAAAALDVRPAAHRSQVRRLAGNVTLYDDCYNSSPVAVDAALTALGMTAHARRVVVLGDMLELGPSGPKLHREAGEQLRGRAELLVGVGPLAAHIVAGAREAGLSESALHHFDDAAGAAAALPALVRAGDAVLVKGSRGVRLEAVVDALTARFPPLEQA